MMDEAAHLARMHPWLRERVARVLAAWRDYAEAGYTIRITESVRSLEAQQAYFAKGASRADGVNNYSFHQFSPALACDCIVIRGGKVVASIADPGWQSYGELAETEGLEWGARWPKLRDSPHVQAPSVVRVKLVQAAVGVEADGIWGPATDKAVAARVPVRSGKGWDRMTLEGWAALMGDP